MVLDASLITGIDPPPEVESALAAINTAHNQVSSRHQPGAGGGRPEDRPVAARGGDRDAQGPGRGRAARPPGRQLARAASRAGPARCGLPAQRAPRALRQGAAASILEVKPMNDLLIAVVVDLLRLLHRRADLFSACARMLRPLHHRRGAHVPGLRAVRQGDRRCSTSPACTSCWRKLGLAAFIVNWLGTLLRARYAARPGVSAQPAGELRGRRADGHRHLVRDVHQRSGRVPVQEHRSARLAGGQREQRHRALPQQHAAGRDAGDPPRHEPDRARRGVAQVARVGLSARLGLHPQGALPRRWA